MALVGGAFTSLRCPRTSWGYVRRLGAGKTRLATTIGMATNHQAKRVHFFNAVDLVNQIEREKGLGKADNLAKLAMFD